MKPHPILLGAAALMAAVSLALGGWQLAESFSGEAGALQLAGPILAVVTAIICITMLDWARNLPRRGAPGDSYGRDEDGGAATARAEPPPSTADCELADAVHSLEGLARDAADASQAIEGAVKTVADFARASAVALWLADDAGTLALRAECAEGTVTTHQDAPVDAADEEELRQAVECRVPLEVVDEDAVRFLFPLFNGDGCAGVLRVIVPASALGGEPDAVQRLSSRLTHVVRAVGHAVGAPGAYERAVLDAVTGVYSRRHLVSRLTEATSFCRRYGEPLSLVLLDVDNFGIVNGSFGRAAADRLLRAVAVLVRQNVRDADTVYRYGPDEIAVLLPNTECDRARTAAERLRRVVRESRTIADDGNAVIATVSGGVAEFDEDMRGIGPLLERAEEALRAAGEGGRDRIRAWEAPAAESAGEQAPG